jgi:hypothetical protein
MNPWREKDWRIPLKGELVKDKDGIVGIVTRTIGTVSKRHVWVNDIHDNEIHDGAPSEHFEILDVTELKKFQLQRLENKHNISVGTICYLYNDVNLPFKIILLEWNDLYQRPFIWLDNQKEFDQSIIKIDNIDHITPFDLNIPPIEQFFSNENSKLNWRLDINLIESTLNDGWGVNGNEWRFSSKDSAMKEFNNWSARLKIRRICSVIAGDWKPQFPCWTIEMNTDQQFRVCEVKSFSGFPAYFKTATHAAYALSHIPNGLWLNAYDTSIDSLFDEL